MNRIALGILLTLVVGSSSAQTSSQNPIDPIFTVQATGDLCYESFKPSQAYARSLVEKSFPLNTITYDDHHYSEASLNAFKTSLPKIFKGDQSQFKIQSAFVKRASNIAIQQTLKTWMIFQHSFGLTKSIESQIGPKLYSKIKDSMIPASQSFQIVKPDIQVVGKDVSLDDTIQAFNQGIESLNNTCSSFNKQWTQLQNLQKNGMQRYLMLPETEALLFPNGRSPNLASSNIQQVIRQRSNELKVQAYNEGGVKFTILSHMKLGGMLREKTDLQKHTTIWEATRCLEDGQQLELLPDDSSTLIATSKQQVEKSYAETIQRLVSNQNEINSESILSDYIVENPSSIQNALILNPNKNDANLTCALIHGLQNKNQQLEDWMPVIVVGSVIAASTTPELGLFAGFAWFGQQSSSIYYSYELEKRIRQYVLTDQIPTLEGQEMVQQLKYQRPFSYANLILLGAGVTRSLQLSVKMARIENALAENKNLLGNGSSNSALLENVQKLKKMGINLEPDNIAGKTNPPQIGGRTKIEGASDKSPRLPRPVRYPNQTRPHSESNNGNPLSFETRRSNYDTPTNPPGGVANAGPTKISSPQLRDTQKGATLFTKSDPIINQSSKTNATSQNSFTSTKTPFNASLLLKASTHLASYPFPIENLSPEQIALKVIRLGINEYTLETLQEICKLKAKGDAGATQFVSIHGINCESYVTADQLNLAYTSLDQINNPVLLKNILDLLNKRSLGFTSSTSDMALFDPRDFLQSNGLQKSQKFIQAHRYNSNFLDNQYSEQKTFHIIESHNLIKISDDLLIIPVGLQLMKPREVIKGNNRYLIYPEFSNFKHLVNFKSSVQKRINELEDRTTTTLGQSTMSILLGRNSPTVTPSTHGSTNPGSSSGSTPHASIKFRNTPFSVRPTLISDSENVEPSGNDYKNLRESAIQVLEIGAFDYDAAILSEICRLQYDSNSSVALKAKEFIMDHDIDCAIADVKAADLNDLFNLRDKNYGIQKIKKVKSMISSYLDRMNSPRQEIPTVTFSINATTYSGIYSTEFNEVYGFIEDLNLDQLPKYNDKYQQEPLYIIRSRRLIKLSNEIWIKPPGIYFTHTHDVMIDGQRHIVFQDQGNDDYLEAIKMFEKNLDLMIQSTLSAPTGYFSLPSSYVQFRAPAARIIPFHGSTILNQTSVKPFELFPEPNIGDPTELPFFTTPLQPAHLPNLPPPPFRIPNRIPYENPEIWNSSPNFGEPTNNEEIAKWLKSIKKQPESSTELCTQLVFGNIPQTHDNRCNAKICALQNSSDLIGKQRATEYINRVNQTAPGTIDCSQYASSNETSTSSLKNESNAFKNPKKIKMIDELVIQAELYIEDYNQNEMKAYEKLFSRLFGTEKYKPLQQIDFYLHQINKNLQALDVKSLEKLVHFFQQHPSENDSASITDFFIKISQYQDVNMFKRFVETSNPNSFLLPPFYAELKYSFINTLYSSALSARENIEHHQSFYNFFFRQQGKIEKLNTALLNRKPEDQTNKILDYTNTFIETQPTWPTKVLFGTRETMHFDQGGTPLEFYPNGAPNNLIITIKTGTFTELSDDIENSTFKKAPVIFVIEAHHMIPYADIKRTRMFDIRNWILPAGLRLQLKDVKTIGGKKYYYLIEKLNDKSSNEFTSNLIK
jgi:hypothetical protein